jgi:hypothetical protein
MMAENPIDRLLSEKDIPTLVNHLTPVASKCSALGLQLGLKDWQIKNIEKNRHDCESQLQEILVERLNQEEPLSLRDLVTALSSDSLREHRVAHQIESHLTSLSTPHQARPNVSLAHCDTSLSSSSSQLPSQQNQPERHPTTSLSYPSNHPTNYSLPPQVPTYQPANYLSPPQVANSGLPPPHPQYLNQDLPYNSYPHHSMQQRPPHNIHHHYTTHPPLNVQEMSVVGGPTNPSRPPVPTAANPTVAAPQQTSAVASQTNQHPGYPQPPAAAPYISPHQPSTHAFQPQSMPQHLNHGPFYNPFPYHPLPPQYLPQQSHAHIPHPPPNLPYTYFPMPYQHGPPPQVPASAVSPHNVPETGAPAAKRPREQSPVRPHPQPRPLPSQQPSTSQRKPPLVTQYIDYVRTVYRKSKVERDTRTVKWPPTPSKVYINLVCIDRGKVTSGQRSEYEEVTKAMVRYGDVDVVHGKKWPINFDEIAAGIPDIGLEQVVLVEGAPGVGKSTFAWEFCRRWERGEIAQQYDLVLLLRLRDDSISKAKCLKDLIYHPSEKVCEAVVSELESCLGGNVLLLLEGYDELPDECRCRPSFFLELINGQVLPFATLLITSRPWATSDVMKNFSHRIYQHIEVLGFTKRQITSYIHRSLPQKEASELEDYLLKHSQIQMCMYIPLNCAIVVTVYKERKNALPKTLTELYSTLARTILLRYLRSKDTSAKVLASFDELPSNEHSIFCDLCELAYNSIAGDQVKLIFTDLPADFDSLGFMDSVFEFYVTRKEVASHNFLHLTLQEFLAAVHISGMEPNTRVLEHFNRYSEGKLRVVLRFLAGLTHLKDFNSTSDFINVMGDPDDAGDTVIDYSVSTQLGWVYEAQRGDIVRDAFEENKTVEFTCEDQFDSSALGYCVANSRCKWVLSIGRAIGEEAASIFVEEAKRTHGTGGQIIGVRGKRSDDGDLETLIISLDGLNIMFKELKMYLQELAVILPAECSEISWPDLSSLRVLNLGVTGKMNMGLNSLLPHLPLTKLVFSCYTSSYEGNLLEKDCEAIAKFIDNNTSLEELWFSGENYLDIDNLGIIFKAMEQNKSLPLQRLTLDGIMRLDNYDLGCLAEYIESSTTLKQLDFPNGIRVCSMGALDLARALREKPDLCTEINVNCVVYGDMDVPSYVEMVRDFPEMLEWDGEITRDVIFDISDEGVEDLAEILEDRYEVTLFELSSVGIGNDAVKALARALDSNSTLKKLYLSDNEIDCDGVNALATALKDNITLEILKLNGNKIGNDGAEALANVLQFNSSLTALNLSNNTISDDGIEAIARALYPEEPSDHVNDDRARPSRRRDSSRNTALEVLTLSHNQVGDKGAMALSQALRHNSTLTHLTLLGNPGIGAEGVHHLIQALTVNASIAVDPSGTGGLVLDKKNHERYAVNFPDYTTVKRKITFM